MSLILEHLKHQEQQQEELTFEEICPNYSYQLSIWDNLTPIGKLKIMNDIRCKSDKCIVGEAHDGNSNYDCHQCSNFAGMYTGFPLMFPWTNGKVKWEVFEDIKTKFVTHFNQEHR